MMFRRKPKKPEALTGARTILRASHREQSTGDVHAHEWEITAWWRFTGTSADIRKYQLEETLKNYQGKCLPDRIAWAENLARYIMHNMENGYSTGDPDCVLVEIARHKEGLFARWPACF